MGMALRSKVLVRGAGKAEPGRPLWVSAVLASRGAVEARSGLLAAGEAVRAGWGWDDSLEGLRSWEGVGLDAAGRVLLLG